MPDYDMVDAVTLEGTEGDSIQFQIWPDGDLFAISFDVHVQSFLFKSPFRFNSIVHEFPSALAITELADAKAASTVELVATNFSMMLYHGTWGVRKSVIAECRLSSVGWEDWPDRTRLAEYLLDQHSDAAFMKFAFSVSDESLQTFAVSLKKMIKNVKRE